jgi:hypothetical protein
MCASSVGNFVGTLKRTDFHSLRYIYGEFYGIICLINDTYHIPNLAFLCCTSTGVVFSLYEGLILLIEWEGEYLSCGMTFTLLVFKKTFLSHSSERSKVFKNSSGKIYFRKKLQKRIVKDSKYFLFNCRQFIPRTLHVESFYNI